MLWSRRTGDDLTQPDIPFRMWGQRPGSERDSEDDSAFHLLSMDAAYKALAGGRLHLTAPGEAQVRYMAVDEHARGCG
jgi:hypothetical protein